jgi:hypothetical protein
MLRRVGSIGLITGVALWAAACGFQAGREAPTGPTSNSSQSLSVPPVGVWNSASMTIPDPKSCGNFEWKITSQTSTSMAGDFSASCMNGAVEITGSASGHIDGTIVPMTASGQAVASGLTCPFALTGTGHILDQDSMRVDYTGTTCAGPV